MMEQIRILSCCPQDVTVIGNAFLDRFLPEANGDFLRVYLYLLRSAGRRNDGFTLCSVADRLNCTENDVLRALRYWEREKVLGLTCAEDGSITEVRFLSYRTPAEEPGPVPEKASEITSERMSQLGENEEIRELFFVAQQYIGRPLSRSEMQKICFFYDTLHFSTDLIDYLIDYCVSRGKMSFHYMEKVALSWKEQGISTVHEARVSVGSYHREYYDILKALGINNHHPIEAEIRLMRKWLETYRFPMEIIGEACSRTLMGTGKPTLAYADIILTRWFHAGVRSLEDVKKLDDAHEKTAREKKTAGKTKKPANAFTEFDQRDYNYDELESQLLQN